MIAEAKGSLRSLGDGRYATLMGSDTSTAISNMLLATGNYMKPGAGAYPLRGHNNVQGASDHGAMPNFFPGYQKVDDPAIRAKFEKAWNVTLPPKPGLDNHMMIDAIHEGKLKAMYLFGEEMSLVDSNANFVAMLCRSSTSLSCRRSSSARPASLRM
jgi:formate dehydrogenase major subunit